MELHRGIDLRAPVGSPVRAIQDSVIVDRWTEDEGGNCIKLASRCRDGTWPEPAGWLLSEGKGGHDDSGFRTSYAHLMDYAANANIGAVVKRGDVIGRSGQTGNAKGPHLHVNVEWLEDGWVDTRIWIDPRLLFGPTLTSPARTYFVPPGQYVAPQGAIVLPRGAPAAQAKREAVIVNSDGNSIVSINMGNGASVAGSLQVLPEGVF